MTTSHIAQQIVETIVSNRISTTEVADALGKKGVLSGISAVTENYHRVGIVRPIFAANNTNYGVHEQIKDIRPGEIAVIYTHNCDDRAVFGDIVTKFVTLYRRAAAIVVDGYVRDAARLRRERYPVWAKGLTPLGCFNKEAAPFPADLEQRIRDRVEGGVAVCDDGGVVLIPRAEINEAMIEKLHCIELQEDLWYYCLDVLKWDTKKIVCDKAYMNESALLPKAYSEKLASIQEALHPKESAK